MLHQLAHAGVEHADEAQAAAHAAGSNYNWPVILSMTVVIVFATAVTIKLMSVAEKSQSAAKKGKSA